MAPAYKEQKPRSLLRRLNKCRPSRDGRHYARANSMSRLMGLVPKWWDKTKAGLGASCDYSLVISIASTILLVIYLTCFICFFIFGKIYIVAGLRIPYFIGSLFNLAFFVWGMTVLAKHMCDEAQSIVLVVLTGLAGLILLSPLSWCVLRDLDLGIPWQT